VVPSFKLSFGGIFHGGFPFGPSSILPSSLKMGFKDQKLFL